MPTYCIAGGGSSGISPAKSPPVRRPALGNGFDRKCLTIFSASRALARTRTAWLRVNWNFGLSHLHEGMRQIDFRVQAVESEATGIMSRGRHPGFLAAVDQA